MQVTGTRGASNSTSFCLALGPAAIIMKVIISKREILARKSKIWADKFFTAVALRRILWTEGPSQAEKNGMAGSREKVKMDNSRHEWIRPISSQNPHPEVQQVLGTGAVL